MKKPPIEDENQLFKKMAEVYVAHEGQKLKVENSALSEHMPIQLSPGFEKRLYNKLRFEKFRRTAMPFGSLAACLLVFFMCFQMFSTRPSSEYGLAESDVHTPAEAQPEIIPLSFQLPDDCSVSSVTQDRGQTVYYIVNAGNDNIVLTAEKYAGDFAHDGLKAIEMNGETLYAVAKPDYSLFAFVKDDIVYRLTCQYDYHTLLTFCEKIL